MKLNIITFFTLLPFVFSGCNEPPQQSASTNDIDRVQQNESETQNPSPASADSASEESHSEMDDVVFGDKYPEVLAVKAAPTGDTNWRFNVTLSSLYDSPERYADAWRVLDGDGTELGIRVLGHDHAGEQPFTRSGTIEISSDIKTVFVEGRDQANGWSGQRFEVVLKDR